MLIPLLQTFSEGGELGFQTGIQWIDTYILATDAPTLHRLYRICGFILLATWLRSFFNYLSGVYSAISRIRIVEDLRMRVVDQLRTVSLRFFSETRGGDLLNSILREIGRSTASVGVLFSVVNQGTMFLIYITLMLWISWELTLISGLFIGLLSYGLTNLIHSVRQEGKRVTSNSEKFTSRISRFLNGIRTIVAFNRQDYEREILHDRANTFAESVISSTKKQALISPLSHAIISTLIVGMIVGTIQFLVLPGQLDIAYLLTYLFILLRTVPTIRNLNAQRGEWAANRAGLANVAALLREEDKPYQPDGEIPAPPLEDAITFENVSFSYEPGQPVLKDISIRIERGEMTALVGASGAGKSTLADLIPRFYDPNEGVVLYDGTDLRKFKKETLRQRIGVVSQDTFIFNDTARFNIAYGRLDASDAEIREVAEQANALEFIEEMDEGFDTMLGDRGVRLSGGQRQRIAIARALLKDPEILILDEATSSLDSVSERLVQASLERLMEGRTVVAIAHRLSTIENADWVVVVEDGRVVEQGPYQELLERRGQLWEYHSIQYQMA